MDRFEPRTADEDLAGSDDWLEGDDEIVTVGGWIPHVEHVAVAGPLTLFVRFDNGVEGRVRFEQSYLRGIWSKLGDPEYFNRVGIMWGAVSWPNEDPDMAPDRMHDEIVAGNGEWILN